MVSSPSVLILAITYSKKIFKFGRIQNTFKKLGEVPPTPTPTPTPCLLDFKVSIFFAGI